MFIQRLKILGYKKAIISDYDQKKLLATKAIQTKSTGEPRTPTPSWSGLGFSNSMPESVIRENLELNDMEGATANGK